MAIGVIGPLDIFIRAKRRGRENLTCIWNRGDLICVRNREDLTCVRNRGNGRARTHGEGVRLHRRNAKHRRMCDDACRVTDHVGYGRQRRDQWRGTDRRWRVIELCRPRVRRRVLRSGCVSKRVRQCGDQQNGFGDRREAVQHGLALLLALAIVRLLALLLLRGEHVLQKRAS